jgi:hypothetical protein
MIRHCGGARLWLVSGVLIGGALLGNGQALAAAPAFSVTTSPVSAILNVKPGGTATTTLQLMNNDPQPLQMSVELETFSANGTTGEAKVTPIAAGNPSGSWVHFSQATFAAQPGVWTPIQMTVTLPPSAALGYYYAVLFKPTLPAKVTPGTNTIKGSNAILVLVDTHSANEQRGLQIASFATTKKLYEYLPASFTVTVRNSGNIFVPPTGDIFISKSSSFNKVIDSLPINMAGGNVLPGSVRIFTTNWNDGFPVFRTQTAGGQPVSKGGKPVQQLHWDFTQLNKLRFGKYYAHLALVYNNGTQDIPVDSVVSFWVVPWKLLTVILVVLVLIVVGLAGTGRALLKRLRKARRQPKPSKP